MFHNEPANLRLTLGKSSARFISRRIFFIEKPLSLVLMCFWHSKALVSYHSNSFSCVVHANSVLLKLDNTASLSTRFSASKSAFDSLFRRRSIDITPWPWSSPERSFRRDCGRFGRYLRSYREQCLSGCYRV